VNVRIFAWFSPRRLRASPVTCELHLFVITTTSALEHHGIVLMNVIGWGKSNTPPAIPRIHSIEIHNCRFNQ
jgi:hypothetical protein